VELRQFKSKKRIDRGSASHYDEGVTSAAAISDLPTLSGDERWDAVLARDRRYDGVFVYAVRSTGIYCRPTCASRRPRRTQVTFFAIPEIAERAGYRACRRCHPATAHGADPAEAGAKRAERSTGQSPRWRRIVSHAYSSASSASRPGTSRRAGLGVSSRN
jgi:methylphosphotriester-DNA--protein-cysteine methyltransferase